MKLRLLRFFAVRVKAASRRRGSAGNYFRRAGAIVFGGRFCLPVWAALSAASCFSILLREIFVVAGSGAWATQSCAAIILAVTNPKLIRLLLGFFGAEALAPLV